jgi:hypothetical protein
MSSSLSMDAYKSHDLSIMMKTSSGDVINLDLSNKESLSLSSEQNQNGSKTELSFSSIQSFKFSMQSNGLDEQDKKEITAFMKVAQPYLDKFTKELEDQKNSSPINIVAKKIADVFEPMQNKDTNTKNFTKNSIVELFDQNLKTLNDPLKAFDKMQTLLDKTLSQFDKLTKELYA